MEANSVLVTVVVPVYNAEKYLEECIESILSQDFPDFEVICVNDGSVDGSICILKEKEKQDNRLRIINQVNKGYGSAVNIGIEHAKGKYVCIIEPDDYILEGMIGALYQLAERYQLDMISSDYYWIYDEGNRRIFKKHSVFADCSLYNRVFNSKEKLEIVRGDFINPAGMFRRDFLAEHRIYHHETPGAAFQDRTFCILTIAYGERMMVLPERYYCYRHDNPASSIANKNNLDAILREYEMLLCELLTSREEISHIIPETVRRMYGSARNAFLRTRKDNRREALVKIKKCFSTYFGKDEYMLAFSPQWYDELSYIIQDTERFYEDYISIGWEVHDVVEKYKDFIIFGAGEVGKRILSEIWDCDKKHFLGFAVTSEDENGILCMGYPVRTWKAYMGFKNSALILGLASLKSRKEVTCELETYGFQHVYELKSIATRM